MIIELYPLDKAVIEEKEISFGMARPEVEKLLGESELSDGRAFYYDNAVCIEYDEDDKVEYIEVSSEESERHMEPMIYGLNAFTADAKTVYDILKKMNRGRVEDIERGYSYAFLNISVGISREVTSDDFKAFSKEMEEKGKIAHQNPDLVADLWKDFSWTGIGIGKKGCYDL